MTDNVVIYDRFRTRFGAAAGIPDNMMVHGRYHAIFREASGRIFHEEEFDNFITVLGKAALLDTYLLASASTYTSAGSYMGIIGSTSFTTGPAVTDTLASHGGWTEAGTNAPTFSGNRLTCAWSASTGAPVTKALSAGLTFTFTGSGTVNGGFIVAGTGATNTIGGTAGVMLSSGSLATPQPVVSTNTLTISYSATMT